MVIFLAHQRQLLVRNHSIPKMFNCDNRYTVLDIIPSVELAAERTCLD
jgi:hypothetical protein